MSVNLVKLSDLLRPRPRRRFLNGVFPSTGRSNRLSLPRIESDWLASICTKSRPIPSSVVQTQMTIRRKANLLKRPRCEQARSCDSSVQGEQFPPQCGAAVPDIPFLLPRQRMPEVRLEGQIQNEAKVVPWGHSPCFALDFVCKSDAENTPLELHGGHQERPHVPVFQVLRQLLQPARREFLQSIGNQPRALGEELARLDNDLSRPESGPSISAAAARTAGVTLGLRPQASKSAWTCPAELKRAICSALMVQSYRQRLSPEHAAVRKPVLLSCQPPMVKGDEASFIGYLFDDNFVTVSAVHPRTSHNWRRMSPAPGCRWSALEPSPGRTLRGHFAKAAILDRRFSWDRGDRFKVPSDRSGGPQLSLATEC